MNFPTHGPCWLVFKHLGVGTNFRRMWFAAPSLARSAFPSQLEYEGGKERAFRFSTAQVEPFTVELDAVAAALAIDGGFIRVEAGDEAPLF